LRNLQRPAGTKEYKLLGGKYRFKVVTLYRICDGLTGKCPEMSNASSTNH